MRCVESRPSMTDSELKICDERLEKHICKMDEACKWACDEVYI